jgi:hypothetical protein
MTEHERKMGTNLIIHKFISDGGEIHTMPGQSGLRRPTIVVSNKENGGSINYRQIPFHSHHPLENRIHIPDILAEMILEVTNNE